MAGTTSSRKRWLSEAEVLLKRALAIIDGQILHLEIDVRSELALVYGEMEDSRKRSLTSRGFAK